jgi:hypothetical protein
MNAMNCFDCHELEQELKIARLMADTAYQRGREDAMEELRMSLRAEYGN